MKESGWKWAVAGHRAARGWSLSVPGQAGAPEGDWDHPDTVERPCMEQLCLAASSHGGGTTSQDMAETRREP